MKNKDTFVIGGPVGEKINNEELEEYFVKDNFLTKVIEKSNKESKIEPLFNEKEIKKELKKSNVYDPFEKKEIRYSKKRLPKLHEFASKKVPRNTIGVLQNSKLKLFKKHMNNSNGEIWLSGLNRDSKEIETADLSGIYDTIPKDQKYSGDRLYIINGKLVSAWALYYGRNAIRSPEDYQKNVDLVWNVPYLFGSLDLKSKMGLGANYKVNDKDNSEDSEIEKWCSWLLKQRLNINTEFRKKCAFHEELYGNYYIHIHRDSEGIPDKLTILQPERVKVYLDPLTTKILFYMYLPPIMGGTIMESYAVTSYPGIQSQKSTSLTTMTSPSLRFPVPIIIPVNDMIHNTANAYSEYPFGFSYIKPCLEVAQTRFDCNIMVPYFFKKYIKPTIHWYYDDGGMTKKLSKQKTEMENVLENAEPGSDMVTSIRWQAKVVQANQGQSEIYAMLNDCDSQIFATVGVPETYFKPKGTTDRMVSNEDKTFLGSLKQKQKKFADSIFKRIIVPSVNIKFGTKKPKGLVAETASTPQSVLNKGIASESLEAKDIMEDPNFNPERPLFEYDNYYKMDYPVIEFEDITKTDITQEITNTTTLLNNDIITHERAAQRLGEKFVPELKKYIEKKRELELEEMESGIKKENEYQSSDFTNLKGGLDMNKQQRTSELMNPEGKYKRADNKLHKNHESKTLEPKGSKKKNKTETADNTNNYLKINGEQIPIVKED